MDDAKRVAKIQEKSGPLLEAGETARAATWGNTAVPIWLYLLFFPTAFYAMQKGVSVVLTDRNVYLLKTGLSALKARSVQEKHPIGSVPVAYSGGFAPKLVVGDTTVHLQWAGWVKRGAEAVANGAGGAPQASIAS
jgi:hypothetical protein